MVSFQKVLILVVMMLIGMSSSFAAVWSITYPRALNTEDKGQEYPLAVLKLALEKTGVRFQLQPTDRISLREKSIRQLDEKR